MFTRCSFFAAKLPVLRQSPGGKRLYHIPTIRALLGDHGAPEKKTVCVLYARVSSPQQKAAGDLQRQIEDMQEAYPTHEVISDVGSGLNFKRPGFKALLERVHQGTVTEVVVRHKDRLCRYGRELVEWIFAKAGTRLVVLSATPASTESDRDHARELADDLLAITTVFVARHNGQRSAENRRRRKGKTTSPEEAQRNRTTDRPGRYENAQSASVPDTQPE
jgi:putative resolvase